MAQLASSWVRSTRNLKQNVDQESALKSLQRRTEVSWACGPRLDASRATQAGSMGYECSQIFVVVLQIGLGNDAVTGVVEDAQGTMT